MNLSPKLISALKLIGILKNNGFDAYIVGGFARDYCISILRSPAESGDFFSDVDFYDIDITCSAEPSEVEKLFPKTLPSGLKYGTMTVIDGLFSFEVTTFRKDVSYPEGGRKPEVSFSKTLEEDVLRRDFTMNALALNSNLELIDLVGGRADIERGLIRTVGEARERFREDSLRKLRALRFVSKLGFDLDEELKEAIREDAGLVGTSAERIRQEFSKILMGDYVYKSLSYMRELKLFEAFVPEIVPTIGFEQYSKYHDFTVFEHIIKAVANSPKDEEVRTAAFLHDIAKPLKFTMSQDGHGHFKGHDKEGAEIARKVLERLKYPVKTVDAVTTLIAGHHSLPLAEWRSVRRFVSRLGFDLAKKQLSLALADNSSKKRESQNLDYYHELEAMVAELEVKDWALKVKDLEVDGNDLIEHLGLVDQERPLLGRILEELLVLCLQDPETNTRPRLLELAKGIYQQVREEA